MPWGIWPFNNRRKRRVLYYFCFISTIPATPTISLRNGAEMTLLGYNRCEFKNNAYTPQQYSFYIQSVEKHCNALPTITHAHPHKLTQNVREKIKKIKKNNR
jgi:hypothetical protein